MDDASLYHLRWADAQDADTVSSLVQQLLSEISGRIGHKAFAVDPGVATVAQSHVLYAAGMIGIIQEFYVLARLRSGGLGAQMLDRIGELARRRSRFALELCTPPLPEFDRTLAFYERHDFQPVGGRKMRRAVEP